jgi:hypothetical protein
MTQAEHQEFLVDICREFLELVDKGERDSVRGERSLKELLCRLSLALVNLTRPSEWDSDDCYQPPPQTELREVVHVRFPRYGHYNSVDPIVDDVGSAAASVGDAIDDIMDIYNELHQTVWVAENLGSREGVRYLLASYYGHWGRHLRDLQLYLHEFENAL